jgi:hypothetical protein
MKSIGWALFLVMLWIPFQKGLTYTYTPHIKFINRVSYDIYTHNTDVYAPQRISQSNLDRIINSRNLLDTMIISAGMTVEYPIFTLDLNLFSRGVAGGDLFTLNSVQFGEAFVEIGKDWSVRLKAGRHKLSLGHELILGFNEWSSQPTFIDAMIISTHFGIFEIDLIRAKLHDKSTLSVLSLQEQLLWQPYLSDEDFVRIDRDLAGFSAKLNISEIASLDTYLFYYFNRNLYLGFNEITELGIPGLSYSIKFDNGIQTWGEIAFQFGKHVNTPKRLSYALIQNNEYIILKSHKHSLSLFHKVAYGSGSVSAHQRHNEFIYILPDFHRHLGKMDLFGLSNLWAIEIGMKSTVKILSAHTLDFQLSALNFYLHDANGFLREPSGFIRSYTPNGTDSNHLGIEGDFLVTYTYDPLTLEFLYGIFIPGNYDKRYYIPSKRNEVIPHNVMHLLTFDIIVNI